MTHNPRQRENRETRVRFLSKSSLESWWGLCWFLIGVWTLLRYLQYYQASICLHITHRRGGACWGYHQYLLRHMRLPFREECGLLWALTGEHSRWRWSGLTPGNSQIQWSNERDTCLFISCMVVRLTSQWQAFSWLISLYPTRTLQTLSWTS